MSHVLRKDKDDWVRRSMEMVIEEVWEDQE